MRRGAVLAHRMVWSLVFLSVVLAFRRQWSWLRALTRKPRLVGSFAVSATLLSGNWFLYILAVGTGHVIDASFGYFINPLVNIVLGFVLLKERLRPTQWIAVFIAALGPLEGLSLEALLLFPLAAAYLAWAAWIGNSAFIRADFAFRLVMMAAGPITAIPLLLFAAGARRIRLSTLGLLQFIAPSLQLLLGIWMFHEPFGGARMWGFVIIWAALAWYSAEGLLRSWRTDPQAAATSHASAAD